MKLQFPAADARLDLSRNPGDFREEGEEGIPADRRSARRVAGFRVDGIVDRGSRPEGSEAGTSVLFV